MASSKELSRFVRDALRAGQSRGEIAGVLGAAGWSVSEIDGALRAWSDTPNAVPVPRPQTTVSARDFFVYTLTFGLLLFASIYLVQLLHALIDLTTLEGGYRTSTRIRWAIAVLVVTVPLYLWLVMRDRRALARDPALYRSAIRKWLTYLALLAAATVLLGDLVTVIYTFLDDEMTVLFLLKSLVVGGVAGGIFLFYLRDIRKGDTV